MGVSSQPHLSSNHQRADVGTVNSSACRDAIRMA